MSIRLEGSWPIYQALSAGIVTAVATNAALKWVTPRFTSRDSWQMEKALDALPSFAKIFAERESSFQSCIEENYLAIEAQDALFNLNESFGGVTTQTAYVHLETMHNAVWAVREIDPSTFVEKVPNMFCYQPKPGVPMWDSIFTTYRLVLQKGFSVPLSEVNDIFVSQPAFCENFKFTNSTRDEQLSSIRDSVNKLKACLKTQTTKNNLKMVWLREIISDDFVRIPVSLVAGICTAAMLVMGDTDNNSQSHMQLQSNSRFD